MTADLGMGWAAVIASSIAAFGALINTVLAVLLRRFVAPPSGNTLGEEVEQAHHQSAVAAAGVKALIDHHADADDAARIARDDG